MASAAPVIATGYGQKLEKPNRKVGRDTAVQGGD
jgi:hypothetical protein